MSEYTWIGKRVIVFWTDEARENDCDWPAFRVLDECEDGLFCVGVNSPDGTTHDGSKAFIPHKYMADIIEWKEDA